MRTKLRRAVLVVFGIQLVTWIVGQVIARRLSRGDERSDEFRIAAVVGGRGFASRAGRLRSGSVVTWMGGVDLDLRGATLDPAGASLAVTATMGGVQVRVPETWRVEVEKSTRAGGVDATVTAPDDLPAGAPTLRVRASARMGGISVTTGG